MKTARKDTAAMVQELSVRIGTAVKLQQCLEFYGAKLKAEKEAVRTLMEDAGIERHATSDGAEALLVEEERFIWNVEKLAKLNTTDELDELCPRKPDGAKLRKMMESSCEDVRKALRACARASKATRLELRAPEAKAEAQPATKLDAAKEAAA